MNAKSFINIPSTFPVGWGSTKCLEIAIGLPTSATSMKPHTSIVLEMLLFTDSKSFVLQNG